MQMFHVIVLTIAIIVLILALTLVGLLLGKRSTTNAFPPIYSTCPDYWTVAQDGSSCIIPTARSSLNVGSLYTNGTLNLTAQSTPGYAYDTPNNQYLINFSDPGWQGICSMSKWANNNGVVWDGVTNFNQCSRTASN